MTDKILHSNKCLEIVQKNLRQNAMTNYSLVSYEILPIDKCVGYMGQYFYPNATVKEPSTLNTKKIHFFIKKYPPKGTKQFDILMKTGIFNTEIRFYNKLFPVIFEQFDRDYVPECYLGIEDNILVLEDMSSKGYKIVADKFSPFDFEHCKIVLETLAKFHSKSIIFEERNKMNLTEFCLERKIDIQTNNNNSQEGTSALYETLTQGILYCIEHIFEFDRSTCQKFKDTFCAFISKMAEILSPDKKGRKVQDHGDLWSNNIMFKYNDGKPIKCCFIDFQTTRYTSPARDILIFLYYTTVRNFRSANAEKLFQIYYDSLQRCLMEVNMDVEKIYPWDEFLGSITDFKVYSLMRDIYFLPIAFSYLPIKDEKSINNREIWDRLYDEPTFALSIQLKENETLKQRILDLLSELKDYL